MLLGVVYIKNKTRHTLAIIIGIFNLICVFIGLFFSVNGIYIIKTIGPYAHADKAEINFVFMTMIMYGMNIIIQYVAGLKMCEKCIAEAHKKSTPSQLLIWITTGYITCFNGLVLAALAVKICKHLVRTIRFSIKRGIKLYLKDPSWKHAIDILQYKLECCGVNSYKDWNLEAWIPLDYLQINNSLISNYTKSDGSVLTPSIPWSCCKLKSSLPCLHDPLQQLNIIAKEHTILETINKHGCLQAFRDPIEWGFIIIILGVIVIFILQIICSFILKILYTSSKNAILLGDITITAPGWIFSSSGNDRRLLLKILELKKRNKRRSKNDFDFDPLAITE